MLTQSLRRIAVLVDGPLCGTRSQFVSTTATSAIARAPTAPPTEPPSCTYSTSTTSEPTAGESRDKVVLVVGAGDATGSAVAKRFAREGYVACVVRRNGDKLAPLVEAIESAGGRAVPFGVDARKEEDLVELFQHIESDIGDIDVAVFNIGANIHYGIRETTRRKFFKVWEMACLAGFLTGREAAKVMVPRERGTIIFTGATASIRGSAGFSAFASAKSGLRAVAQSMARELSPLNIHVAHVVIDGPIDTEFIRTMFPDIVKQRPSDGILNPDDIAENYWNLHTQKRSAWTHELDLRPWVEPW